MKKYITGILTLAVLATTILVPGSALAVCGEGETTSKGQVLIGAGQTGTDCEGVQVDNTIAAVVEILSIIVGIAAIIVIIISGLKYVTSAGDSGKISSAKTTLVYALVGLVIAALAQVLVYFVLDTVDKTALPKKTSAINAPAVGKEDMGARPISLI